KKSEEEIRTFARYYDVYNTIIIFDAVKWNENGEMYFVGGEDNFGAQIKALKQIITYRTNPHKVNIIVTALADGAGGDGHNGVNKLMHANHTGIAEQMVNKFIKPESEGGFDLDGLDIDWEYPQNKKDWECYNVFMKELDEKMAAVKDNCIISAALSAGALKMSKETLERIDQIQYMAYDDLNSDGYQSTLYLAQIGLQKFIKKGAKLSQINIGIPSYGRPTDGGPYWPYWSSAQGNNLYFDSKYDNVKCGDVVLDSCAYCSPALAGDKTALALLSGCGGIMVFRLASDRLMNDPNAVACGIENSLKRYIPNWGK
ncbi:MAG: glycoside hydrolase family 18 protein, partial [Clostridia bacterium]|nr:glycoside hydrolase family 18 protein [Clostridia bacterium]